MALRTVTSSAGFAEMLNWNNLWARVARRSEARSRRRREAAYSPPRGRLGRTRVAVITVIDEEFDEVRDVLGTLNHFPNSPYFVRGTPDSGDWGVVVSKCMDRSNVPSGE